MRKTFATLAAATALLATPAAAQSTDGKNRKIHVENISKQSVRELYASPASAKTWEEDLLGQRTLAAGASINANIDNGTNECQYDLKVVMADGSERVKRNVNVCATTKWAIGDTGDSIL